MRGDDVHGEAAPGALQSAIRSAHARGGHGPAPRFSEDGGGSVFDDWGRCARVQPLGTRTRITLSEDDRMVAEGEVDAGHLIDRISTSGGTYETIAAVLNEENGPGRHSG
ncbi:hypothetical protein [Actinomycetospora cinnamomea]|uniref:Uncharacterized protein n=1 Tax=Actinomycetospora cinnamomea TaxID=663609 RepID=A0A2U1FRH0_9PSEU|nr:hypothetical protein [Actinomycetospora cinnamomea]PVZ14756.1 hypothetical protein C8D89_101624 [Actinomycetospora cinnamomea]